MHSFRPDPCGFATSNCMNAGEACTQRLAFITLEKMAMTPFAPGGAFAAASSMRTYASTPCASARSTSSWQNASRSQRIARPE